MKRKGSKRGGGEGYGTGWSRKIRSKMYKSLRSKSCSHVDGPEEMATAERHSRITRAHANKKGRKTKQASNG